jgi:hypothetical protein
MRARQSLGRTGMSSRTVKTKRGETRLAGALIQEKGGNASRKWGKGSRRGLVGAQNIIDAYIYNLDLPSVPAGLPAIGQPGAWLA